MATEVTLFNGTLTNVFQATSAILIPVQSLPIIFTLTLPGTAQIEWYLEFSNDNSTWFREVAENVSGGAVTMPFVVRTLQDASGANLAAGTYRISTPFLRSQPFARLQIRDALNTSPTALIKALGAPAT